MNSISFDIVTFPILRMNVKNYSLHEMMKWEMCVGEYVTLYGSSELSSGMQENSK